MRSWPKLSQFLRVFLPTLFLTSVHLACYNTPLGNTSFDMCLLFQKGYVNTTVSFSNNANWYICVYGNIF